MRNSPGNAKRSPSPHLPSSASSLSSRNRPASSDSQPPTYRSLPSPPPSPSSPPRGNGEHHPCPVKAIRRVGPRDSVRFKLAGSCTVEEAARFYRLLEDGISTFRGRCEVDRASMELLRRGARHFDLLGALETSLELVELNLKGKTPIKSDYFDSLREVANGVITSAHASESRWLLDQVVIDAQRLGRVCRGLVFGAEDVAIAALAGEDLDWLMAGGAGGGKLPADVDGGEPLLADLDGANVGGLLPFGDGGQLLEDANRFGVLANLADDFSEALAGVGGPLLAGHVDGAKVFEWKVNDAEALAGGKEEPPVADQPRLVDLVEVKAEMVVGLLQIKVRNLLKAIATAKARVVTP